MFFRLLRSISMTAIGSRGVKIKVQYSRPHSLSTHPKPGVPVSSSTTMLAHHTSFTKALLTMFVCLFVSYMACARPFPEGARRNSGQSLCIFRENLAYLTNRLISPLESGLIAPVHHKRRTLSNHEDTVLDSLDPELLSSGDAPDAAKSPPEGL